MKKDIVRTALIGCGSMGSVHASHIAELDCARLVCVSDIDSAKARDLASKLETDYTDNWKDLLNRDDLDALVISTPHYDHTTIVLEAFSREAPLHVLVEKPVGVHVNDVDKMIRAYKSALKRKPTLLFSAMFQQRTLGQWQAIKSIVDSGELGRLMRASWIITDWFRTQIYYDNGGWRGTWEGEGGGVLLNQCPHNLDLFQWITGIPEKVTGFASIGKYHNIEVEDEVTAVFQYANGMVGHFMTSTAEAPGTNRLEITGEKGKLVFEDDRLVFHRNKSSSLDVIQSSRERFATPESSLEPIAFENSEESPHKVLLRNFCHSVQGKETLLVSAEEGLHSVALANAIILSQYRGNSPVDLPLDGNDFESLLNQLIKESTFKKNEVSVDVTEDEFSKSF